MFQRLMILGIIFLVGCAASKPQLRTSNELVSPANVIQESSSKELSDSQKRIICNDIDAYFDWCYQKGISAQECGQSSAEKLVRLYDLTPNQVLETTRFCQENDLIN